MLWYVIIFIKISNKNIEIIYSNALCAEANCFNNINAQRIPANLICDSDKQSVRVLVFMCVNLISEHRLTLSPSVRGACVTKVGLTAAQPPEPLMAGLLIELRARLITNV